MIEREKEKVLTKSSLIDNTPLKHVSNPNILLFLYALILVCFSREIGKEREREREREREKERERKREGEVKERKGERKRERERERGRESEREK